MVLIKEIFCNEIYRGNRIINPLINQEGCSLNRESRKYSVPYWSLIELDIYLPFVEGPLEFDGDTESGRDGARYGLRRCEIGWE